MTEHVRAELDLFLGPLLCDFNDFWPMRSLTSAGASGHGFPLARVFHELWQEFSAVAVASTRVTSSSSSTLMHLQLVALTWKCIHHEWLEMNEWMTREEALDCKPEDVMVMVSLWIVSFNNHLVKDFQSLGNYLFESLSWLLLCLPLSFYPGIWQTTNSLQLESR